MKKLKSRINVLFIDNNDEALDVLNNLLSKDGIEITNFRNYETALNKIDLKKHFDIVIANTFDSSTGWINFIKLLKAYSNSDSISIILGSGSMQDLLYATEIEAKKYFTTPYESSRLADYVQGTIDFIVSTNNQQDSVNLADGWIYSFNKKSLIKDDEAIQLTNNEISFMEALIKNNNKIVTYDELKVYIYKTKNLKSDKLHAIRTLARNIRAKTDSKNIINTLNRIGYKIKIID
ncbi:MAG: winged helix-turn-helix domain-containing protein [Arcobacteraceae bacterium]|nr:winged helix-turn-helix domain-containing protein [Arcobacteraceae bacterium]MDY0327348.1 winged helix-turn-helix domain-containing protein [Arcobacteraceae bacterium]